MIPIDVRINNFLGAVSFVADEQSHRAVWLEGATGVTSVTSIGELYCQFFDDNDLDGFIKDELNMAPLSTKQKTAIASFRAAMNPVEQLQSFQSDNDLETIESPEWKTLVLCARETLSTFGKSENEA